MFKELNLTEMQKIDGGGLFGVFYRKAEEESHAVKLYVDRNR